MSNTILLLFFIASNTMADNRISNLTPYNLVLPTSNGTKTTIPFTGNNLKYYKKDDRLNKQFNMEVNDWPTTLANTSRTAIVTEDVGRWITRPENAHNWLGQVVGPVGLADGHVGHGELPKTVETSEWVMYKDVTPPLRKVVFERDQSLPPFSFI